MFHSAITRPDALILCLNTDFFFPFLFLTSINTWQYLKLITLFLGQVDVSGETAVYHTSYYEDLDGVLFHATKLVIELAIPFPLSYLGHRVRLRAGQFKDTD